MGEDDKRKIPKWRPKTSWEHEPKEGSDRDPYAVTYVRTDGERDARITVEFVAGGEKPGSRGRALAVLRQFSYQDEVPPRRVLVQRDGSLVVLEPGE